MDSLSIIQKILVMALPLVYAIVLHEVAHGWIANKLGDPTARDAGRLTLNPIPHIDLFGTVIMPLLLIVMSGGQFVFGYAKPVPINPSNFREPRKGLALSSVAGPGVNILMAVAFAVILRTAFPVLGRMLPEAAWEWAALPVALMLAYGVVINVVLAVLNMLPIPPLDGSRVVLWLLPPRQAMAYNQLERYGMFILLALFATGALNWIVRPLVQPLIRLLLGDLMS